MCDDSFVGLRKHLSQSCVLMQFGRCLERATKKLYPYSDIFFPCWYASNLINCRLLLGMAMSEGRRRQSGGDDGLAQVDLLSHLYFYVCNLLYVCMCVWASPWTIYHFVVVERPACSSELQIYATRSLVLLVGSPLANRFMVRIQTTHSSTICGLEEKWMGVHNNTPWWGPLHSLPVW